MTTRNNYELYWMGKHDATRRAVEEYISRSCGEPRLTQLEIAKKHGIAFDEGYLHNTCATISKRVNELLRKGFIKKVALLTKERGKRHYCYQWIGFK